MSVESRRQELLTILSKQTDYLPVKDLANLLNVSIRTIHKDIVALAKEGCHFDKKQGYGVYLKADSNATNRHGKGIEIVQRRLQILQTLLFGSGHVTIQALSDCYYVSPSSILSDLQYIRDRYTNDDTAQLFSNIQGTRFCGNEEEMQKLYMLFNENQIGDKANVVYNHELRTLFTMYYEKTMVDTCISLVESFKEYTLYSVAQHYIFNVSNSLIVLAHRLREGHHHTMTHHDFNVNEIMNLNMYLIAKDLLEIIKTKLCIHYEEADIYYLSIYLQSNRVRFIANAPVYETAYEASIHNMIDRMSKNVGVDLMEDEDLYKNISLHISHMKYRLNHHVQIRNPLLKQIKAEFRLMFDLTWLVLEEEKENLGISIVEDEVGFLMLHFQSALDKAMQCRRVLVVCPNGYTTSNYIINRIRRVLPPLDILEAVSLHDIDRFDLDNIDLIISTVPLDIVNKTVIVVSSLINEFDIDNIANVYASKVAEAQKSVGISNTYIRKLLDPSLVFVHEEAITQQYVIDRVCDQLYKKGYVHKGFKQSVLERETKGGTAIASMAAIPHGDLSLVHHSQIAIWVNKVPLKWGKYQVKVIIFFCLSKADIKKAKRILEDIFSLIETKQRVEKQIAVLSETQLYDLITGGEDVDREEIGLCK